MTSDNEQDITNGIIKVVSGKQKKVYFTQGHGEKDTASSERDGYSAIAAALGRRELHGRQSSCWRRPASVPDDASVVVVAGPKTDFFPPEIDAMKKYLGKAGKLLLMLDPPDKPDSAPLTNLIALAHDWGIDVGNNVVVDASGMGRLIGTDASVPVAANYPSHPITRAVQRHHGVSAGAFGRRRCQGGVNGHTAQTFIETSPRSWAETDIKSLLTSGKVSLDEGKDTNQGPVSIAAAVTVGLDAAPRPRPANRTRPKPETRVVVFGDSDFAVERRPRHPGQSRPVHEHARLAVAAGEPHLDPAEGSRRPPHDADGDAAEQHHGAVAADRSGPHLRHRASIRWWRRR